MMSPQPPRLEARVSVLERMQKSLYVRIEELAQDMTESFKQQVDYQIQSERRIDARFDKLETRVATIEATMATKEDIAAIRSEMATKEDIVAIRGEMAAMEGRMLDAFKQLLIMVDSRLPAPQK